MNIELTKEQYRMLQLLAYLGDHMLTFFTDEESPELRDLIYHLNSHAEEAGAEDLVREDAEDGLHNFSESMEVFAAQFIETYDENMFWNELAERLTARDVERLEKVGELPEEEDFYVNLLTMYLDEFVNNGVDNLVLDEIEDATDDPDSVDS